MLQVEPNFTFLPQAPPTHSTKTAPRANGTLPSIAASTATVESPTTLDAMATNTWAYATDQTNYKGVPTSDSPNLIADINGTITGTTSDGSVFYSECGNVTVDSNDDGYMTVTCTVTPSTETTGITLHTWVAPSA